MITLIITTLMLFGLNIDPITNLSQQKVSVITQDVDLKGQTVNLPDNSTLNFRGGIIKNGTLIGHNTEIECSSTAFENVNIQGSWNVPEIHSSWFRNLTYVNALKDVFALTNPAIKNKVYVSVGEYTVSVSKASESSITIDSNTDVVIDGTIHLLPNHYSGYNVVMVAGENINISGIGKIVGDRASHKGDKGEWGMGIRLSNASNVTISGLTITECWGDCIYIGDKSRNIIIDNCVLDHGRRQGVSVVSAENVTLSNLLIKNINGTAPEYAIDVEPNKGDRIDNVLIENVTAVDCEGGIFSTGYAAESYIGEIIIRNAMIERTTKMPIRLEKCASADISGCTISDYDTHTAIRCNNVDKVFIRSNKIYDINKSQADIDHANKGKRHVQIFNSKIGKSIDNQIYY